MFIVSLLLAAGSSAWFTRRLEAICAALDFPPSLLSLLGALGANIPNYVASLISIAGGKLDIGLGIIIGSNIYNIAIILAIVTFATPKKHGILLTPKTALDARTVAVYTLAIMLATLCGVWLLPETPLADAFHSPQLTTVLLVVTLLFTLGLFGALVVHALRRVHHEHDESLSISTLEPKQAARTSLSRLMRWIGEALLSLTISLAAVVVMVQSGSALAHGIHLPEVLVGLLILAVATSLPNTIVAFILARSGRETACVEEIFSSNSINATLGIALPLLFLRDALHDHLLLFLDTPFMLALTLGALICIGRRRVSRSVGGILLLSYVTWIVVHMLV
ncbi:MAG: hypothetical protein NVSMB44_45840 [Ktedonobacteraceae bacterium]